LSAEDQAAWDRYNRSFVALAGLEWRIQTRAMQLARRAVDPARFLEIRYEDFCDQPQECVHKVLEFAEMPSSDEVNRQLVTTPILRATDAWRNRLTAEQQRILEEILDDDLGRYGYK
jgi:hypothetical protein